MEPRELIAMTGLAAVAVAAWTYFLMRLAMRPNDAAVVSLRELNDRMLRIVDEQAKRADDMQVRFSDVAEACLNHSLAPREYVEPSPDEALHELADATEPAAQLPPRRRNGRPIPPSPGPDDIIPAADWDAQMTARIENARRRQAEEDSGATLIPGSEV